MKIAILTSNRFHIGADTKKGTEIVFRMLVESLTKRTDNTELSITAFCSGDSDLPVRIESIEKYPTSHDLTIPQEKNIIFELALISKAFSMQDNFDLYHINIGDGDIALPFAPFVKKPILITLHNLPDEDYKRKYFSLFRQQKNLFFISTSNTQRSLLPELNYAGTIYHGIEIEKFKFDPSGGENIIWAGRGMPDKGFNTVLEVVKNTGKIAKLFPIRKAEFIQWLDQQISDYQDLVLNQKVSVEPDQNRDSLISQYQSGKLFLFPSILE